MKRRSLGVQLVVSLIIISIIPIVLMNLFSYYNISRIVNDNNNDQMKYNLNRTKTTLDISIESYEDVLYQIYSDDEVVSLINRINNEDELIVSKNQLRRALRGYFYAKDYIKDITVITKNGTVVFYDSITGSTTRNSWIPVMELSQEELYKTIVQNRQISVMLAGNVIEASNGDCFLFHLGHRVVDFKKKNEQIGIVILSIDEEMLDQICMGGDNSLSAYNFIVDWKGRIVSYKDKKLLGSSVDFGHAGRRQDYEEFVKREKVFGEDAVTINYVRDDHLGWDIINVSSQREVMGKINKQQKMIFTLLFVSIVLLIIIIIFISRGLTGSIKSVVASMQSAGEGQLEERVQIDEKMPSEVEVIARQYNTMMDKLMESVEKEKLLDRQKKDAEITALEAQLNPHFLYNTLDTINWIAIGKKEFEISRAITALAVILRYGIDNSNGIVTIREEYEWLKQYLLLQQTRLSDGMESYVEISPEAMHIRVHKLLFQPFIENSFVHGFKGIKRKPVLKVFVNLCGESVLEIVIEDNGKGIPENIADEMNRQIFSDSRDKNQIGLRNALYRIRLYYGDDAEVYVEGREDKYTRIRLLIPASAEGEEL